MKNITIRDSGNKEVLEAYFLNHEGQPYNLENKTVTFMENKDGDKFVSDPNVQIVNATAGFVRYTLQSQVHSAPGIAWFEINDDSGLVDSTGNFNIRVENGLRATADNTTYIAALEKLKQQMEALIQQADGELKTELQRAEQQLNQELQNFRNQYNSLSNDFQNQFKSAQNARQADYNKQKDAINADWFNTKNNINKNALDTINAIKSNAKQVLDEDQADWNAKQKQWDSTFSAIVKEWQVKTNSLNATVQDLTNKFNTIIGQVSDLMNNKLPAMDSKTDAIQAKIDELRKELPNLNKIKLRTQSLDWSGNKFENIQTATKQSDGSYQLDLFDNDWTAYKVNWLLNNTASYNIEANTDLNHVKAPGLYHCSGASNIANVPDGEDNWFNMVVNSDKWNGSQAFYATDTNQLYIRTWNNNGFKQWRRVINDDDYNNLSTSKADAIQAKIDELRKELPNLNKIKLRTQSLDWSGNKFENIQTATKQSDGSYQLDLFDNDWTAYKVNWLLNNTASYNIEANTDLNHVKAPGLYHCSGASNIANVPDGEDNWFNMVVNSDKWNGSQAFYATDTNQLYIRTWNNNGFKQWRRLVNDGDYSSLQNLINSQKLKVVRSYDIEKDQAGSPATEAIGSQCLVDQVTLAAFADAHRDVRNHTDYRYPTDITQNTAINLNSDPYLNDGIYRIDNCAIINGPWDQNGRHWFYLRTIRRGEGSINQFIIAYNELWFRGVSKSYNEYPAWQKLATTNTVQDLSDRLTGFMQTQSLFQRRVDYESPSGTITNDTVDFNNYRETGILKVVNCLIQNGPYKSENRHSVFLKVTNLDGQTQYQTVYEGDNLYGRKLYNGSGQWHKYTNTPI